MSTDRFTPVKPQRRRQRRSTLHNAGLITLIAGILLFGASSLGARAGFTVLPFDPHHIIGQLAGAGVGLVGASLIGRRQQ